MPNNMDEYPLAIALKKKLHDVVKIIIESDRDDLKFNVQGLVNLETSEYPEKEKVYERLWKYINDKPMCKNEMTHL